MNHTQWIRREAARWAEEGLITPEQRERLILRYPESKTGSPLLLFFAIIGCVLIGAGVVLVFATNWWQIPVPVKLILAFCPLLAAQAACLYTLLKRSSSAPFREGAAVLLSLSFFAAVALIGQVFHTPSSLESYVLVCILFSLPGVYFFRSKAAMTIYAAGAVFVVWSWPAWVAAVLVLAALPFFLWEAAGHTQRSTLNYLLVLLSALVSASMIQIMDKALGVEMALACGLALFLLDALVRKKTGPDFFSSAKLLGILCVTGTLLTAGLDFSHRENMTWVGFAFVAGLTAAYGAARYRKPWRLMAGDLFAAAAVILTLSAPAMGVAANLLAAAIGVFYIVEGSRTLTLSKLNFGMVLVVLLIAIRFFDSSLDLLGRGIVFILLGGAFLALNLYISRKRKEERQ